MTNRERAINTKQCPMCEDCPDGCPLETPNDSKNVVTTAKSNNFKNIPMGENDADAATVGEYLKKLLLALWDKQEGFSGKRPFGNSGWSYEIYAALVKAGVVPGELDEDGYVADVDYAKADEAVQQIIKSIFEAPTIDPVKRGEWLINKEDGYIVFAPCSVCGICDDVDFNFCPNCGAQMGDKP